MTTTAVECARLLVQELAPDQGQSAGRAFGLAVSLQAMLEALHDPSCEDDGLCQKLGCLIANFHMRDLLADSDPVVSAGAASALAGRLLTALAAAPAPSSLAGGAIDKAMVERLARYMSPLCFENRRRSSRNQHAANKAQTHYRKLAKSVLRFPPIKAALSPEAPAREGVVAPDQATPEMSIAFANAIEDNITSRGWTTAKQVMGGLPFTPIWSAVRAALTPRHEAPASEGDA